MSQTNDYVYYPEVYYLHLLRVKYVTLLCRSYGLLLESLLGQTACRCYLQNQPPMQF